MNKENAAFEVVGEATASLDESGEVTLDPRDYTYLFTGAPIGSVWGSTTIGLHRDKRWMVVGREDRTDGKPNGVVVLPIYETDDGGVRGRWDRMVEAIEIIVPADNFGEFWHDDDFGLTPLDIAWNLSQYAVWQAQMRRAEAIRLREMADRNERDRQAYAASMRELNEAIHEYADEHRLCSDADDWMEEHGLQRRRRTYRVSLKSIIEYEVEVNAVNEDEAKDLAVSEQGEGDFAGTDAAIRDYIRVSSYETEVTDVETD
jgi:hypothetical protein